MRQKTEKPIKSVSIDMVQQYFEDTYRITIHYMDGTQEKSRKDARNLATHYIHYLNEQDKKDVLEEVSHLEGGIRRAFNIFSWPFRKLWAGLCFLGRGIVNSFHRSSSVQTPLSSRQDSKENSAEEHTKNSPEIDKRSMSTNVTSTFRAEFGQETATQERGQLASAKAPEQKKDQAARDKTSAQALAQQASTQGSTFLASAQKKPNEAELMTLNKQTPTNEHPVIQIFIRTIRPVKNLDGSIYPATITLDVSLDETIASVVKKYMDMEKLLNDEDKCVLMYANKRLKLDVKLSQYNITKESTLHHIGGPGWKYTRREVLDALNPTSSVASQNP